MRKKSIITPIAESLKLPKDLTRGDSIISLTGNEEAWIENYKGIIEYTPERIFLQLKTAGLLSAESSCISPFIPARRCGLQE